MELFNPLLIVVDPAHGGRDTGAVWSGRQEKDDSLRLGQALREALIRQGTNPLMTRDTDVYVPLEDRVNLANANNADLYISLHRAFSPDAVTAEYGVQNSIYLMAPEPTTLCAATQVLNVVAEVGVQANRGISPTNQYVLRRTVMPAMSLEMGFLNNEEDNRLFDAYLHDYAEAITRGILSYFGVPYTAPGTQQAPPDTAPPPNSLAPSPVAEPQLPPVIDPILPPVQTPAPLPAELPAVGAGGSELVRRAQRALGEMFAMSILEDGVYGTASKRAAVRAMQTVLNVNRGTGLAEDGILGTATRSALPVLREGDRGDEVALLQILLLLNGYDPGNIDGIFGPITRTALTLFQRDNFLVPDGVAGPRTLAYLLQ